MVFAFLCDGDIHQVNYPRDIYTVTYFCIVVNLDQELEPQSDAGRHKTGILLSSNFDVKLLRSTFGAVA